MLALSALKVLILAGGVSAAENHHSHLVHVQGLQRLLAERGVAASDVAVFWADGAAAGEDRSVAREAPPPDAWLVAGLPADNEVNPGPALEHTAFPGEVRPDTRAALRGWLAEVGPTLRAEDTLLIAVTDHGEPDPAGGTESRINLWGEETYNPTELLEDLAPVGERTRVVLWMSQCHSGGFAELARRRDNLCGTFSATADRVAYGCYPELAGREDVGHFQRLLEAFSRHEDLAAATAEVMVTDDSPDVPHLTSDALLYEALTREADRVGAPVAPFIDARLQVGESAEVEADRRLAAEVALRYGLGAIRDHSAAMDLLDDVGAARYALESWQAPLVRAFDNARELLVEEAVRRVGEPRTREAKLKARQGLLAGARKAWGRASAALRGRIEVLRGRVEAADGLGARLDLQEAAALRVAWLQGRVAGPLVLDAGARRRLAQVHACERAPLIPAPTTRPALAERAPLPLVRQGVGEVEALRPGHLGLEFRDRPRYAGVLVDRILPGSPCWRRICGPRMPSWP
ncbi:MAG: C13 family peptidase [bacterium]